MVLGQLVLATLTELNFALDKQQSDGHHVKRLGDSAQFDVLNG
jgi:hypothetical protein